MGKIAELGSTLTIKQVGLVLGPVLAITMLLFPAPEGMQQHAWYVSALAVCMACWWITEAFPLAVTGLLPIIILPTFNIMEFKKLASSFSNPIIFLFLGGFIISVAMKKYKLHLRFALFLIKTVGKSPGTILAGTMAATGFLALWMSNTATAIMMFPIAISIASLVTHKDENEESKNDAFAKAMILCVAYSAALGGLGTFVGTPVNAILLGHIKETYNETLYLVDWMKFGIPIVICSFTASWSILYFFFVRGTKLSANMEADINSEYAKLGKIDAGQRVVMFVAGLTVTLWLSSRYIQKSFGYKIEDAQVALLAALLLFVIPINFKPFKGAINWSDAVKIPWGVLIFFGGSLSLSAALTDSGVTAWLSNELRALEGVNVILLVIILCLLIVAVSELMSNIATITAFLPILTSLSDALGVHHLILMIPATLAASCGFMMPGASAANALAYSTGKLKVTDMIKSGFFLNLSIIAVIVVATFTLITNILGLK